jgi:hypothetical protein
MHSSLCATTVSRSQFVSVHSNRYCAQWPKTVFLLQGIQLKEEGLEKTYDAY